MKLINFNQYHTVELQKRMDRMDSENQIIHKISMETTVWFESYKFYNVKDDLIGYLCIDRGHILIYCPDILGYEIYNEPLKHGHFINNEERYQYLENAIHEINKYYSIETVEV